MSVASMQMVEQRSINISVMLHVLLILVAFVGLPHLLPSKPDPTPLVMTVEVLPITGVTNVKPSPDPIQKEQNAKAPPKPVKDNTTPPPMKIPTPPKPTPAPQSKPKDSGFNVNEGAEPAPDAKKDDKKEDKKEEPKKDNTKSDFDKLMDKMSKETPAPTPITDKKPTPAPTPTKPGTDSTTTAANKTKSDAPYDPTKPLSLSEMDAIKSQIIPNWSPPAGAKDANTMVVRVKVEFLQDGTVKSAEIAPDLKSRYASDIVFRAAADAAIRAVFKTKQLKNMPPDKFSTWQNMEMTFDPKDLM